MEEEKASWVLLKMGWRSCCRFRALSISKCIYILPERNYNPAVLSKSLSLGEQESPSGTKLKINLAFEAESE